jgi:heme A synthase
LAEIGEAEAEVAMVTVHIVVGSSVILLSLLAGAIGGVAWFRDRASIAFWYLLRAAQVAVFLQAMLGGLLVFTDHKPAESLHYLYGILPLFVSFLAEGARTGAAQREIGDADFESLPGETQQSIALAIVRREMGIMAVGCWVIFFLAVRAATTGG